MKNKRPDLSVLFYSDRFALTFSVLMVTALWLIMVTVNAQKWPRTIYDVPVTVKLSETSREQRPKVFERSIKTVKVPIRGNSIVVNRIKPGSIQAVTTLVLSAARSGSYPLLSTAQRASSLADHEVVPVEPSIITTNADIYKEVTLPAQDDVTYKTDPDYFASAPSFSSDTVVTSGPEKEIAKTKKVSAEYDVRETLTRSKNFTTDLMLCDTYRERLSTDRLNMSVKSVNMNITALVRKVTRLSPTPTGKPMEPALSSAIQKIDPETVGVAGPEDALASMNKLGLETVDLSKPSISNQNLQVGITPPPGYRNLSNVYTAPVTLGPSGFKSKKINMTDFQIKNLAASKSAQVFIKGLVMTLIGPAKQIDAITAADVYAQIDMTGRESFIGHLELLVTLAAENHTSVWAYGEHKVSASVMKENGRSIDDPILTDERDAISHLSLW